MRHLIFLTVLCTVGHAQDVPKHVDLPENVFAKEDRTEAPAPTCTLDDLTKDCKLFDLSRGDKIQLKDGTWIPNFSSILAPKKNEHTRTDAETTDAESRMSLARLNINARAREILADVKLPANVKEWLGSEGALRKLFPIDEPFEGAGQDADSLIFAPWPLDNPVGFSNKSHKEIVRALGAQGLDPKKMDRLRFEVREAHKQNAEAGRQARKTGQQPITTSPERQLQVMALMEKARRGVIDQVGRGRPDGELNDADKKAILKLESVTVTPYSESRDKTFFDNKCPQSTPQAFYDPNANEITLCQGFWNFPDSAIMAVAAHEWTHPIDPCNIQFGVEEINGTALATLTNGKGPIVEIARDGELSSLYYDLVSSSGKGSKSRLTALPFDLSFSRKAIDYFRQKGVLKEKIAGSSLDKLYPLADVYNCLKTPAGGGFRAQEPSEVRKIAEEVATFRAEVHGADYDAKKDRAKIESAFLKFPECAGPSSHSQLGEAVADKVSSRVVGEFLTEESQRGKTLTTADEKLAPVGFFASLSCMEKNRHLASGDPGSAGFSATANAESSFTILTAAYQDLDRIRDPHPSYKRRVDRIFMQDSKIRHALGCPPGEGGC